MTIDSVNPTTGERTPAAEETTPAEVDRLAEAAATAAEPYGASSRVDRAAFLDAISEELERRRPEIVELGRRETALPQPRLAGELTRTAYQARFFADVLRDGGFLEATIDHPAETPMGASPDLRRILVPIGPVAVFGASNFPLAFSVPGGDTVSALAAGCSVVIKAHDSHPALSALAFEALTAAAERTGQPPGVLGLVFGLEAGAHLVAHPSIRAVGFTGSLGGGRALLRIIEERPEPIPFYGELSSLNPVVITPDALRPDLTGLASQLVTSVTGSGGQLCTKPGLVLVPRGDDGDRFVAAVAESTSALPAATLLNERISDSFQRSVEGGDFTVVARGAKPDGESLEVSPVIAEVDARSLGEEELEEHFGPFAVLVRYGEEDLDAIIEKLPSSLTATVWSAPEDADEVVALSRRLGIKAGRIIFGGWPTGVHVGWAQHHGGPWPATNTLHTSVGATSIRRFLRPMVWQNAPEVVLPPELRDGPVDLPRRVDGQLTLPS